MIKIGLGCTALVVLWCTLWQCASSQICDLSMKADVQKAFPNVTKEGELSYQMAVELTTSSDEVQQTDFIKEYCDYENHRGRVDSVSAGKSTKYYYYNETNEAYDIDGETCKTLTMQSIPSFMKESVTDWSFEYIRGPSAMFLVAQDVWINNRGSMAYMGEAPDLIRGLKAQYWRRCMGNQVVEYYFTVDSHEDAFGFEKLKQIPLKVNFSSSDTEPKFFPQTYEIISFQPFVSDDKTLEVPSGIGCRRNVNLTDVPTVPDFSDTNLITFGEASFVYGPNEDVAWNYYSTFMFAMDLNTDHMAYFYTPWGGTEKGKQTPNGFVHVTYDMKNFYVYQYDFATDQCSISRDKSFSPNYYLPRSGGYISLTDPSVLFPNNEFQYIADGVDRGLNVHIFERVLEGYPLGNRTVPKVIVTHNYLKDNEVIDNTVEVRNTTFSMQFKFFADKDKAHTEQLTMNLFGFSTEIEHRQYVFSVFNCFKNDDDYLLVTIGFPADPKLMDKIKTEAPSIEENVLNSIMLVSELNALRIPVILIDFADMIYAKLIILDKPPVALDYLEPENDKTITGTSEVEGIMSLDGCAISCLESETSCWGFAYCGATCYFGTGATAAVTPKAGCKVYRRFNNESFVPSKDNAAANLRKIVEQNQLKIAVPTISDIPNDAPEFLEATYIEVTSPSEPENVFGLLGKQTDPRLRVVKAGYRLEKTGNTIKNFGKLRYDECQRLCLDYRRCETVSYCVKDSQCVLSLTYGEDLPKDKIKEDSFCNLLTRKYADHFDRSPGNVLSIAATKVVKTTNPEECAKACVKETSFSCMSFDLCPDSDTEGCRLHKVHILDVNNKESVVSKQVSCGHYSKKFSYDFKRDENKKSVGLGFIAATNITMEQCAKRCNEYLDGVCFGYDFCADKTLISTTCFLLNDDPGNYKTTYSPICNHFTKESAMAAASQYPASKVAWVGVVSFFVAAIVGVLLTLGIAYYKANRSQ